MPGDLPFSPTVIATTGERFSGFAPYAASVNDARMVAFQATLRAGGSGVFTGSGGAVVEVAGPGLLAGVTSHPDVNDGGATGEEVVGLLEDGASGVPATVMPRAAARSKLLPDQREKNAGVACG